MIGSPASRGAVASFGGAGRGSLAAASAVSAVRAAIAASVMMAGGPQRRAATVVRAVLDRFAMSCPERNACSVLHRCIHDRPRRRKRGPLPHLRRSYSPGGAEMITAATLTRPPPGTAPIALIRSSFGTAIGSPECAGSAAAGKAAGHGPAQASRGSYSRDAAVRTVLSGAVLSHHFATGDNHRIGGTAAGCADARENPRAVDICRRHHRLRCFFATRGSALQSRFCFVLPALRARLRAASRANRTATFRRYRCCRRRPLIARAPG